MNELKTFYFTFASSDPLCDNWIEIRATSSMDARRKMVELHGTKWGCQYEEADWEPKYFPAGRHGEIIDVF